MLNFNTFGSSLNVAVIGASGGIGQALIATLSVHEAVSKIYAFARTECPSLSDKTSFISMDICREEQIESAARQVEEPLDIVIVATGMLHSDAIEPEKGIKSLNADIMHDVFSVNTIGPALVAKHFIPLLSRDTKSVFAILSARVGSISDNHLGGWYSYRASKAALNMFIKTASIETARKYQKAAIIGLHPGTVDTNLSKPFQDNVKEGKLFSAEQSAHYLLDTINKTRAKDTGKIFAFDGQEILP